MTSPIVIPVSIKGFFKIEAINVITGKKRVLADWFPNKILDSGRNYIGENSGWLNHCQVGTSSVTPQASDTGLLAYFAGTSTIQSNIDSAQASPPYYGYRQITYRFAVGTTATPLSEVGVGWSASAGSYLITRGLIVDGDGNPTTVTPLADEILDVTYQMRYYPPLTDVTGTIELGGITYDTIIRAAQVNSATWQSDFIGEEIGAKDNSGSWWVAYDGALGTLIQAPSGLSDALDGSPGNQAYSNNSYYRDMYVTCGPNGWNLTNGIRSILITTSAGRFQIQFTAQGTGNTVPKDVNNTMSLEFRIAWVEGTIA